MQKKVQERGRLPQVEEEPETEDESEEIPPVANGCSRRRRKN